MLILPAVVVSGLVLACLVIYFGYLITYTILMFFVKRAGKLISENEQDTIVRKQPRVGWKEDDIQKISMVGGGMVLGLVILLLFSLKDEQRLLLWVILTVLGVIFGFLSFAIVGSMQRTSAQARPGPVGSAAVPPHSNNGHERSGYPNQGQAGSAQQDYIIVVCVNCAQKLRIPRQKRKLIITCPQCRTSFPYSPGKPGLISRLKKYTQSLWEKIQSALVFKK
jgi:hypothetical protein